MPPRGTTRARDEQEDVPGPEHGADSGTKEADLTARLSIGEVEHEGETPLILDLIHRFFVFQ